MRERGKMFGQHFLEDTRILDRIVAAAELSPGDTVLEIGPGSGSLTAALLPQVGRLIAVEKDAALIPLLKRKFASAKNLTLVHADVLEFDPAGFGLHAGRYKIVANIPYYLTGRLLRLMIESWPRPERAVLMLQKEVAERIVCRPPKMNRLAALMQHFSSPRIVTIVKRRSFRPPPGVDSAVIAFERIRPRRSRDLLIAYTIATGFSHPRKLLASNLKGQFGAKAVLRAFKTLALPQSVRPAELHPADWGRLSTFLLKKE